MGRPRGPKNRTRSCLHHGTGISKVSADGGTPAIVTTADGAKAERHVLPHLLPGDNALLFTLQYRTR